VGHRRAWAVAFASLIFPVAAFSIDPARAMTQYVHRSWTIENGLPQNNVQVIAQTPDGYLWFGTEEGVARFDGVSFTVFNPINTPQLQSQNIGALFVDRAGALWIGGGRGVSVYRNGKFETVAPDAGLRGVFGIAEVGHDGTMVFSAWLGGLYWYKNGVVRHDDSLPATVYMVASRDGVVWVGATDGLYRIAGGVVSHIAGITGSIEAIYCTAGGVWAGGPDDLVYYDGTRVTRPVRDANDVWTLFVDSHGTLWIGTRHGLVRKSSSSVTRMGVDDGLTSYYIDAIFEDAEGTLWVGTHFGGVNQLLDGVFLRYTRREGLSDAAVWSVVQDRSGAMLAGTAQGGLNRLENNRWKRVVSAALDRSEISALWPDDDGSVWIASDGNGLHHLKNGVVRTYTTRDGLPSDELLALLRARDGSLWIGSAAGAVRFRNGKFETFGSDSGLGGEIVISLHEDRRGRIWAMAGDGSGPAVFDGKRFHVLTLTEKRQPDLAVCMYDDDRGDLWFGSRRGLHRLHEGRVFTYTASHGLLPGLISYIFDDGADGLWMSGPTGLFRVARKALDDVLRGRASAVAPVLYGVGDGLPGSGIVSTVFPAAWRAADGRMWMATGRGVAVLDPRARRPSLRSRPIVEEVRIDARGAQPSQGVIAMPADRDRLEFRYTAPSSTMAERIRFRYRLEGHDGGWIDAGHRRIAEYTNLRPGRYRFQVQASDGGPNWLSVAAPVTIERLPALYQTPWFLACCAAIVLSIGWFVHWRQMRAIRLRHEAVHSERRRIALEFHDTVSTGVTGAILQIQSAMDRLDHAGTAAEHLHTGKSLLMAALDDARRSLFDLRAEKLALADEFASMIARLTKGLNVTATFELRGEPRAPNRRGLQHHLLRIAQEALTNALRHSGARRVAVILEFTPKTIVVTVRDDGRGSGEISIDTLSEASHGIRGMRERAEAMDAKLTTRALAAGGFEVIVEVEA
jgi:ligand-binding sensor domain-containing protein/signal transduction histidine kinase